MIQVSTHLNSTHE